MRRFPLGVVAVGLAIVAIANNYTRIEPYRVTSSYVIDGDTLRIAGESVRLWGIQAPERDTLEGRIVMIKLADYLQGKRVSCEIRDRDRYDRAVAMCFAEGEDVARWLVNNGYAEDWPRYSHGYYGLI